MKLIVNRFMHISFLAVSLAAQGLSQFQFTLSPPSASSLILPRDPVNGGYDFGPTGMLDGKHRFWWCGSRNGAPGDHLFYGESNSLRAPLSARGNITPNTFSIVLRPRYMDKVYNAFDAGFVCDPSVIRIPSPDGTGDGDYLLYYSGSSIYPLSDAQGHPIIDPITKKQVEGRVYPGQYTTEIGVLRSRDGIAWQRENSGRSILASLPGRVDVDTYGTGQPSAVYKDGYIYLSYTDHSGFNGDSNGGGMYIVRSKDYLFLRGVEALTASGFVALTDRDPAQPEIPDRYRIRTGYALYRSVVNVDWHFSDMLQAFVIANRGGIGRMQIIVVRIDPFPQELFVGDLFFDGFGNDGPGFVRRPDGHSLAAFDGETVSATSCGRVPLEIAQAYVPTATSSTFETRLRVMTAELRVGPAACAPWHWSGMLNGYQMLSAGLPLAVVVDQVRLQANTFAPVNLLSRNAVSVTSDVYNSIPFGANLYRGDVAIAAPGRPVAFLLQANPASSTKNSVWPVSCLGIVTANASPIQGRTTAQFDAAATARFGKSLYCIE